MPELPATLTPASPADLRDLLTAGHIAAIGEPPPYNRLGVAWSQVMLEIGRGEAIWNFNVGNIKCNEACQASPSQLFTRIPVGSSGEYPIQRAYVSPVEGCASYWRLISGRRYGPTLPLFDAGRAYDAMIDLGSRGYFEAEPRGYATSVAKLFEEYQTKWPNPVSERNGGPLPIALIGALAVAAGALLWWNR